jgi:small GTP-binding protein
MTGSRLTVGIVGLPNAGKSTLFNALASRRLAETAPRPFTTVDPHEAVAQVPDGDFEKLYKLAASGPSDKKPVKVPATVTFIDIAGLVKGAHKGEGLGNQFLAKIREVDAIIHVVRAFSDLNVPHQHPTHKPGSEKQILEDIEIVNLELELGGIEKKPTVYVLNVEESSTGRTRRVRSVGTKRAIGNSPIIEICAKLEEELIDLEPDERKQYLQAIGTRQQGLEKLIKKAYKLLDLNSFYTIKGGEEITAWAKKFIKAEVVSVYQLLEVNGWANAKRKGKIRLEGKDYVVQDKDVIEFKVGK